MKIQRPVIKSAKACDDEDDLWLPWFEFGSHWDLGHDEVRRPRSVSKAAHRAMMHRPAPMIGFHKPRS